jgi:predicted nucleic acid-binding protein
MSIVISNTTPIISFMKIKGLHILRGIFSEVIISKGVYDELTAKVFLKEEINMINNCGFIKIREVKNEFAVKLIQKQLSLDLGESESIVLTNEIKANILIMDERKGRKIAQSMGLNITGTLGVILQAKNKGIIDEVKPFLDKLIENNIRISEKLYKDTLISANEYK